jgi:hypothetical protein
VEELRELRDGPRLESVFRTAEECRAAWERHREALMASMRPGSRPWAFWFFETLPARRFDMHAHHAGQAVFLADVGLLTAAEDAVLGPAWELAEARAFENAARAIDYYRACARARVPWSRWRPWPHSTPAALAKGRRLLHRDPREWLQED